jgi:hypothetical protein
MGWMAMAQAAAPVATTATPEFKMLQGVVAMQGQTLSTDQSNAKVVGLVSNYMKSAPAAGQQERLQKALVDLGIYTDAQASAFIADSQKVSINGSAANASTMTNEITQLAKMHPAGAQFDGCEVGAIVGSAGVIALIVGAILRTDNPTCSAPEYDTYYSDGSSAVTYGPTTCTDGNYYPHATAGDNTMIAGGIVAAVGLVTMLVNGSCF